VTRAATHFFWRAFYRKQSVRRYGPTHHATTHACDRDIALQAMVY